MESRRYNLIYSYEKNHWWYRGRRFLLLNILKKISLPKSIRILDIGCGGGFTLLLLNQFGNVFGVDIEKKSIEFCQKRGFDNIKLVKNNYKLPFKSNFFHLITCLDVLEHIEDDKKYLKEIKRVLLIDGYLIIFVPSYQILWGELDVRSKHQRRYTKEELTLLLQKNDYHIISAFYFNFLFFIPILLIRIFQKIPIANKNNFGVDPTIRSEFINKILTAIFFIDIYLSQLISVPFGVSLCIVAKKK